MIMKVTVKRGDVIYTCTSEEQLNLFLEAGYERIEEKNEEPKKAPRRRKTQE